MIAVDTNVLVYAHRRDAELHEAAAATVRALAEGEPAWAIPWPCIHEFLAIATHPRIYDPPSSMDAAVRQVDAWMESPSLSLLAERGGYWDRLKGTLSRAQVSGPRIHDARVAALCTAHGVRELWTADRDFSRFPDLKVHNPLTPA